MFGCHDMKFCPAKGWNVVRLLHLTEWDGERLEAATATSRR